MHHLSCGISFLLRSVNLILLTLAHITSSQSPCICALSFPRPFTPHFKRICSTNSFFRSFSGYIWTSPWPFTGFGIGQEILGTRIQFHPLYIFNFGYAYKHSYRVTTFTLFVNFYHSNICSLRCDCTTLLINENDDDGDVFYRLSWSHSAFFSPR